MRIGVLSSPQSWHYKDLLRAADGLHDLTAASFEGLAALISNETNRIDSLHVELNQFDCLIVRAMPKGSLSQIVFRMDALQQLSGQGICVLNSPKTIEASVDKYLTLALLKENEIPIPVTGVCQTKTDAMDLFQRLDADVVVKPIFGSQGRGLKRINQTQEAIEYFGFLESEGEVIYLQEFINHGGSDLRLLVVGNDVFSISRHSSNHWITNVSCGGHAKKHNASEFEYQLAIQAAKAVKGLFIGVDLIYDDSGTPFVVDVNAAPGWQAVSRTLDIDIAERLLFVADEEVKRMATSEFPNLKRN